MKSLSEALTEDGVTLTYTSETRGQERVFHGVLRCEGRSMEHTWSQHVDNRDLEPSAASVLGPAIRFAQTAEAADSYEDWAGDFSLDPEEWMPHEDYREWLSIARRLRGLLGDERYEGYNSDLVEHE